MTEFEHQKATIPSVIPVEKIAGPILLICGDLDAVWNSCPNSVAINTRLTSHGRPAAILLRYSEAGHFVGMQTHVYPVHRERWSGG